MKKLAASMCVVCLLFFGKTTLSCAFPENFDITSLIAELGPYEMMYNTLQVYRQRQKAGTLTVEEVTELQRGYAVFCANRNGKSQREGSGNSVDPFAEFVNKICPLIEQFMDESGMLR